MLFRKIFDFIFASPVTVVFSVVSVACVSILVVKITSNMDSLSDADFSVNGSGANNNAVSLQSNDSSQNNVSNLNNTSDGSQINPESLDDSNSAYRARSYAPSQAGDKSNRNNFNTGKKSTGIDDGSERYFVDEAGNREPSGEGSVETINTAPSFNYPASTNLSSENTTSSSISSNDSDSTTTATSNSDTASNVTEPVVNTDGDDTSADSDSDTTTNQDFPSSLEYEVKISPEETQSVSCQPTVANGPPCMCTYTTTNDDGTFSELVDNCG